MFCCNPHAAIADADLDRGRADVPAGGGHRDYFVIPLTGDDRLLVWDVYGLEVLEAFRASDIVKSIPGGIDSVATWEQLEEIEPLIPKEWLPGAIGSAEDCASYWQSELDNGADSVCIHGSTAREVAPALEAFAKSHGRD